MNKKPLISLVLFFFLSTSFVFAQVTVHQDKKAQLAIELGVVYVGMSKKDLYKVFTPLQQKGYYKKNNEEWIIFSDWMTEESKDKITFYLVNEKVKGWNEE